MFRQKPAADLTRNGRRFADKNMAKSSAGKPQARPKQRQAAQRRAATGNLDRSLDVFLDLKFNTSKEPYHEQ
jgi:hypothetical protein